VNWLDYLLAALVAASLLAGFLKGLARSLIGLVAVVVGFLCGLWFYGVAGAFFYEYLSSRQLAHFLGFLIIFFAVVLLGALLAGLLARLLKWAKLGWLDRLMGGAFGLLRGVLLAAALVLAIMAFAPKPPPRSVAGSRLAPYMLEAGRLIVALAPYEVRHSFQLSYERLKEFGADVLNKPAREMRGDRL